MKINSIVVGEFEVNCYLLKEGNEVLIIDPGSEAQKIRRQIKENETVVGIVLTHAHFDHIGAVDELAEKYQCPIYMNPKDFPIAQNETINRYGSLSATIKKEIHPLIEGKIQLGVFLIRSIFAPGHTPGSTLLQVEDILFTGDVLFKSGIGRTDLWGGDDDLMQKSIEKIKTLDPNWLVYPGHGETSTIKHEIEWNPYF